jgi:hypothetical protein
MESGAGHESTVDVHSRFIVMPFIDGFWTFEDEDWRKVGPKALGTIKMYREFFGFWNFQTLLSAALYEARIALAGCNADGLWRARKYVVSLQKQLCPGVATSSNQNCQYPAEKPSYRTLAGQVHHLLETIDSELKQLPNSEQEHVRR